MIKILPERLIHFIPIFGASRAKQANVECAKISGIYGSQIISERKLKRDGNFNEPTKKKKALLDLLLDISENGTVLSDDDIREEVNTFMYAGHDTLATSISWTLYALGRNPKYQVCSFTLEIFFDSIAIFFYSIINAISDNRTVLDARYFYISIC